jgi:heme exporter protein A
MHQQHYLALSHLACERNDHILFENLNRSVSSGEVLLIRGSNGVGKSSLLRIIVGLLSPSEGVVIWNGQSIQKNYEQYTAQLIYIGHQNGLRSQLTVHENIIAWFGFIAMKEEAFHYLAQLNLINYLHTPIYKLSAGQQRKVALMRLIVQAAPIWILDEPFTGVDEEGHNLFISIMQTHLINNGLIIMSSHHDLKIGSNANSHLNLK